MLDYVYYLLGYEEEITPDPKIIKQRHLVMTQISLSKMKLRPAQTKGSSLATPTYAEVLKSYKQLLE